LETLGFRGSRIHDAHGPENALLRYPSVKEGGFGFGLHVWDEIVISSIKCYPACLGSPKGTRTKPGPTTNTRHSALNEKTRGAFCTESPER
jgi:hypothetical protein